MADAAAVISAVQVANELGVSRQRVGQMARDGILPKPSRINRIFMVFQPDWRDHYEKRKPRVYKHKRRKKTE